MPVNTVNLNFNKQQEQNDRAKTLQELFGKQQLAQNQNQAELNLQQIRGQQQLEHTQAQGEQARQNQANQQHEAGKFYQTATGAASPEEGLRTAYKSGAMIHGPGGEAIGTDPQVKQQAAGVKQDNDAYNKAYNNYNKGLDKQIDQVQKMSKLMENLNNPNAVSGGIAKTEIIGALGMNRYNQQEAASIFGPTATGLYSKLVNAMGGSEGSLSPGQIESTKAAVKDMYQAAKDAHEAKRGNALDMYRGNPVANNATYDKLDSNMGKSFNKYASGFEQRYMKPAPPQAAAAPQMQAQQAPAPQQQAQPGVLDKLSSWLKGSSQQPQAAPQQAAARTAVKQVRDKQTGGIHTLYSDGTVE